MGVWDILGSTGQGVSWNLGEPGNGEGCPVSWSLTGLSSEGPMGPCLSSSRVPVPESPQGSGPLCEERE